MTLERELPGLAEISTSSYPRELWHKTEQFALKYLGKGRINFDVPHTRAVVAWAYKLATDYNQRVAQGEIPDLRTVDVVVLVTAAWLHDIGYYGQFNGEARLDEIMAGRARHMILGSEMAGNFLREHGKEFLGEDQIDSVANLIKVHDDLDRIESIEETILLEADTLGAIDTAWVEPTFRGEEALRFLSMEKTLKRHSLFRTPLGLSSLPQLLEGFREFIINRDLESTTPGEI